VPEIQSEYTPVIGFHASQYPVKIRRILKWFRVLIILNQRAFLFKIPSEQKETCVGA